MTKKLLVVGAMAIAASAAFAEGYQVNTLSARQNGMGHTGVAQKLGAESMIFNPAGMAWMDQNIEFSGSFTAIFAHASATYNGIKYNTDNNPSTPMAFNLGMNVYNNLKAGVSFYTPYGSGINWGDNWAGAVLNQSVDLKAFTVQPTLAWQILPNLSIGAGAMVTWGTVDLNKGLLTPEAMNGLLASMGSPITFEDTPASINLKGKAAVTVGINVGAMWDINQQWTVGASYRSKMNLKVKKGEASVRYANDMAMSLLQNSVGLINQANFEASMPAASVLNFGVSYKPINKLILAFDVQFTGWKTYKELNIHFLSDQLADKFDQNLTKDYNDAWLFKLGAQYSITSRFDIRAGFMVDTTPVNSDYYNPETPGMTKLSPSIGFSFSPVKQFSVDASLLYVAGLGKDNASCQYPNILNPSAPGTFTANYSVYAWNPSIGCTLKF